MQSAWACFISLMFVLVGGWLPTAWCWFPLHSSMNQPCPPRSWASAPPRPVPRRHRAPAEPRVTRQPPTSSPFHTRSCIHVTATLSVLPRLLPPLGRVQSLHVRLFCTFLVVEGTAYDRLQASRKMLRTDLFFSRCCLSGRRPAGASSSAERGGSSEPPQRVSSPPVLVRHRPRLGEKRDVEAPPMPAELWLGQSGTALPSLRRLELTQWKRCSVSVVAMFSERVKLAPKTPSYVYAPENCQEILNELFSVPVCLFPNSHLKLSAFSRRTYFPSILPYLPGLLNTGSNSASNCLKRT